MDKTQLVAPLGLTDAAKEQGRLLVTALEARGIHAVAAFWYWRPDLGVWRLAIATNAYDRIGPLATYDLIQDLLRKKRLALSFDDIEVVAPDDPLAVQLQARGFAVGGGGALSFSHPMGESQTTVIYRLA